VRVTLTGHAGLFLEAGDTTLLCDPWFNPAYFGSWFPFPDNANVDPGLIGSPTYLYVSHLHKDHFDARFLAEHVSKETTVLLPEFPFDELRHELEALGFRRFIQTTAGEPIELDGFRAAIWTETTPADGPLGDSAIAIDDGEVRVFNQNDCRLTDMEAVAGFGPYDMHLLQFSGAIWYPMVYRFPPEEMEKVGRDKRANQMRRALRYIQALEAGHVIPFAGPAAFLDDDLFRLNDLDNDPANIFVDQRAFLAYLAEEGVHTGHLMVGGSQAEIGPGRFELTHPSDIEAIYDDKRAYLQAYQARRRPEIDAELASLPAEGEDLVDVLAEWWEPLLEGADRVCRELGEPIVLDLGTEGIVIDPLARQVRSWKGEAWGHLFVVDIALVRSLVERRVEDWINELFLSCRFEAERVGPYNGTVFHFFKCLSPERMAYLEASLRPKPRVAKGRLTDAEKAADGEVCVIGDYRVQRRCPHLGGDLEQFGESDGRILTCTLHGWRFDLATGRCLTADRFHLSTERLDP
jgi:UDP-MurNAc hydroxylase